MVSGDDPREVFPALYAALPTRTRDLGRPMRGRGEPSAAGWPAIVLRTPKGWTGPDVVDGIQVEGTFRAHQVPLSGLAENPEHLRLLEEWLRSYSPGDAVRRRPAGSSRSCAPSRPTGDKRMSATPYANGGRLREDLPTLDLAKLRGAGRGAAACAGRQHRLVR